MIEDIIRPTAGADAAMSPTGADIDNDHADERPVNRSQDAPKNVDQGEDRDTPVE